MNVAREVVASVTIKIKMSMMDNDLTLENALERLQSWPYSSAQVTTKGFEIEDINVLSVEE
jgi:hypothetical protein